MDQPTAPAGTAWLLAGLLAALGLPAARAGPRPDRSRPPPATRPASAEVPQGTDAKVVDGDLRMWMTASPRTTVIVLDYRGAPYLRFDRAPGVFVNRSSAMWYLNQVPVQTPPLGLTARTSPRWQRVSSGHSYEWHDGRLHALASAARAPGATFIGRWTVPLRVGGVPTAITGGLYYAPGPVAGLVLADRRRYSPACWPACGCAVRRSIGVSSRGLAAATLIGVPDRRAGAPAARPSGHLRRPADRAGAGVRLCGLGGGCGWCAAAGWFVLFLIAAAAIWEGATLVGALVYGFTLLAVPAFPARLVVAACLAAGVGLLPVVFALAERPQRPAPRVPDRRHPSRSEPSR